VRRDAPSHSHSRAPDDDDDDEDEDEDDADDDDDDGVWGESFTRARGWFVRAWVGCGWCRARSS
jgi:hypothetical protein